jgi:hypothetical protein
VGSKAGLRKEVGSIEPARTEDEHGNERLGNGRAELYAQPGDGTVQNVTGELK